ncbi:DgyrCDS8510 [Dimorphilus gyrociliatus]|uniref:DgyrCDS8510 n=1 Tax=Dimorphilus gyrociliatus TaxID=2664684 RepID=A0A7I8VUM0_9ANNE|nr:DgyrCDS8510 [Dimorphilus gyrociliatus]
MLSVLTDGALNSKQGRYVSFVISVLCPCAKVKENIKRMVKVLVAVDDSETSLKAFHFYFETAHKPDNEVLFVHGMEYPYIGGGFPVREEIVENILKETRLSHKSVEERYKKIIEDNEARRFVSEFCPRSGEFIVSIAEKEDASLIVMGTRGMGKLRRTILGSVSDYVLHHAKCPVIIARR